MNQEVILAHDLHRVKVRLHSEQSAAEPYADHYRKLLDNHGKMLRASLVLLFARMQRGASAPLDDSVITGAACIEMLHLATLVHDDVVDDADMRRNEPTVQTIVGNKAAIYLGDLILSRYIEIMAQIAPDLDFMREQASILCKILNGELSQESARHHTQTSVDHYIGAITGKTAALFEHSCITGLRLSTNGHPNQSMIEAAATFGRHLGIAFQIADDIEDFNLAEDTGKPKLEDISDGIYTLPVLLAQQENPAITQLLRDNDVNAVLAYLDSNPQIIETSKSWARQHIAQAEEILSKMSMEQGIRDLLVSMLDRFSAGI
ncbi:polyprenyl synthetase family protein [Bifidobacterium aquikefiricola]|uniref:Polyprenyl synthetase family protein n=1 Tax=Bifidobacterium aquikefiricola TaxID=3059038 RepID=A0AB39U4S2_9BIFI